MPKLNVFFNPEGKEILVEGTSYTPTSEVNQLRERVKQLEALGSYAATEMIKNAESKNALAAQVEIIKHVALELSGVISEYQQMQEKSLRVRMFDTNRRYMNRITATPAQCLAEVKAQAGRDAYLHCLSVYGDRFAALHCCLTVANEYADQIRQQAKCNGCYFDSDGMLRNAGGSRSIFDDVDE